LICIVRFFATTTRHHSCLLVVFCQQDAAKLLIAHGADVDKMTLPGGNQTPVYVAAKMGHIGILEVLMLSGASMTAGAGTDCATTPFYAACSLDHFEAAKFLADNGARTALTDEEVPNSFEELKQLCDEGRQSIVESVVKLNPQLLHAKEMVALERMLKAASKAEPVAGAILKCLKRAKMTSKRQPKIVKTLVQEGAVQSNGASNEAMEALLKQEEADVIAKKAKQESTAEKKRRAKRQKQKSKQRLQQDKVSLATRAAANLAAKAGTNVSIANQAPTPTADLVTVVTANTTPAKTGVLAGVAAVAKVKAADKTTREKEIKRAQKKKDSPPAAKSAHKQLSQSLLINKSWRVGMAAAPLQNVSAEKTLTCEELHTKALVAACTDASVSGCCVQYECTQVTQLCTHAHHHITAS
jgi:hypothetical protein